MKLKLVKSILQFYGFKIFDSGEFEADDLIGSLARFCRAYYPVQIVSEDKDFLQCVRKNVKLSKGGFLYDRELCKLKFGVKPSQFIDYLSLTGDSADCIPGADGWGAKNTQKYLAKCGTIENILDEKLTKSLMSVHKLDIELMRKLVRIKTNISVVNSMEELEVGTPDEHRLRAIAQTYHVNIGAFL